MSDLIDKQVVLDTIHLFFTEEIDKIPTKKTEDGEVYVIHKCQPLFEMNKTICKRIKALPSVTAEPKTGHWIEKDGFDGDVYYDCSECGESWTTIEGTPWQNGMNYCPNCGARMESEG